MADVPFKSQGTTLSIGGTAILYRVSVTPPTQTRAKMESTDLDSTAETSLPGIIRGNEVTFKGWAVPDDPGQAAAKTSFEAGTTVAWIITYTNVGLSTQAFNGWITSFQQLGETTTDKLVEFEIKVQITGAVTFTQ